MAPGNRSWPLWLALAGLAGYCGWLHFQLATVRADERDHWLGQLNAAYNAQGDVERRLAAVERQAESAKIAAAFAPRPPAEPATLKFDDTDTRLRRVERRLGDVCILSEGRLCP